MTASTIQHNAALARLASIAVAQSTQSKATPVVEPAHLALVPPAQTASGVAGPRPGFSPGSDAISVYIELEIEARTCADLDALRFAIVNSTRKLAAFEQAFLAEPAMAGGWAITHASSVSTIDRNAPLPRAISTWLAHPSHADLMERGEARQADLNQERAAWGLSGEPLQHSRALWLPLKGRDGRILAAFLALRGDNWQPQHITLLMPLAGAYGHAWGALLPNHSASLAKTKTYLSERRIAAVSMLLAILAAFLPVPLSVLAPAEVVAASPVLVTAPIDGVIGEILAPPGAWVEKDTPILRFADVNLRNDYEVANRNAAVAEAKHFKSHQAATANQKETQDLATTKAEYDVAAAELAYASDLLARSVIRAQRAGLLIYSSKSDWLGKPVTTGERIMEIGNPDATEVRIEIPVSDVIALKSGGPVALFLDGDPLRPISGAISRTSYRPSMSAEGQLVHRVFAKFDVGQMQRIGVRGIARVSGDDVSLWFYLLRRPIAAVRQWIGI